ncbi:hypothetical protein CPC735_048750 [Coccidioides posadasii C735 delta SOWgp]|uniref:UBA domain-containing protein Ucp14 n=1 Tax=Coccidioides posadasii (strain C735) TaxID=222929 RepID=C5PG52_COCP7|nr:hypothetical protein CPC735_048750 [Coccidioides posadasii C735 delta SOWgp]EER23505.1 hypothetical protein CPC735_048750 [Coccidioides posadasii C735 delta SOWgp]|eukprot:XP_003065650.1 hypothetical protein CPC735_048750 [Coccidioides posadasii C735 delta SOWgp]
MLASGFSNATLTKYTLVFIVSSSIAVSIADTKYLFYIQVVPHLWSYWQWWRVLIWQMCYTNSTEVLQACMVLYNLRVVERLWGTRKLASPLQAKSPLTLRQSFIVSTLPYTTLLPPLLLSLLLLPLTLNTLNYLPAGPTAILFALLAQYHAAIPTTYKYHISTSTGASNSQALTLRFSDKSTVYFLAFQLSLSQFPHSLLPAAVGWIIGCAWRAELLPGRFSSPSWRIPPWVYGGQESAFDRRQRSDITGQTQTSHGSEAERYEGLRRRLEGESRAAAAATGERVYGSGSGVDGGDTQRRGPLAGQILDRFRGAF